MKNIRKYINKLIVEELGQNVSDKTQQIEFVKYVYNNLDLIPYNDLLTIETAFSTYFITKSKDIENLSDISLQNLYNTVENKVKTQNNRNFHFYSTNDKNVKIEDLV